MNWILTNKKTGAAIQLYQGMQWIDEFDWSAVAQSNPAVLLGGDQDVQQGVRNSGRPISLVGEHGLYKRGDIKTLHAWSETPELEMTLTHYDGREFDVMFRLHEKAMEATPHMYEVPEVDSDYYALKLNLMEI